MDTSTHTADAKANATLSQNLRHLVDEAEQVLRNAADTGDRTFDAARGKFEHQLQRLRNQLEELEDTVAHKARHAARAADETVHAHPYGAMGLAATVGLLAGILLGRSK